MSVVCRVPAKINLSLEVLGRRPDGYHEIRSLMQTVGLFDIVRLDPRDNGVVVTTAGETLAGENLVERVARLLQAESGSTAGCTIHVDKTIPVAAGLGGGSADAAAALVGLNHLWQLGLTDDRLRELAGRIGSDVPFFLSGGLALVSGRGEQIQPLALSLEGIALLVVPPHDMGDKTARAYGALGREHYSDGSVTDTLQRELAATAMPARALNVFDAVYDAIYPSLAGLLAQLRAAGVDVMVAGSGPTLLALYDEAGAAAAGAAVAERVAAECRVLTVPFVRHGVVCEGEGS